MVIVVVDKVIAESVTLLLFTSQGFGALEIVGEVYLLQSSVSGLQRLSECSHFRLNNAAMTKAA